MSRILITSLVLFLLSPGPSFASDPVFAFEKGDTSTIDRKAQAWHAEFEDNDDYGESWFFLVHTNDDGVLFALMSITNLGPGTFNGAYSVNFYAPNGKKYFLYKEYDRDEITASTEKMDVKMGRGHVWGGEKSFHMAIDEPDLKLSLACRNQLPPYQFGNGRVLLYEDKSAEWSAGINAPRAVASGRLKVGGRTFVLAGNGYHDHSWATIKVPTFLKKWFTLRVFDPKYTIVLHQQYLTKKFGSGSIRFGLVGTRDALIGPTRSFRYRPLEWRTDRESGYKIPTESELYIETNGYTIRGTVKEERFLESIDVLAQISWPIRVVIKAFYSEPYLIRYMARYELDVTDKHGVTEHISGLAAAEANYY